MDLFPAHELIGLAAGSLTTVAFVPQVLRVWRTRSAVDISLWTFALFTLGVALWLAYGLLVGSMAITIANACTLVLAVAILVAKVRFDCPVRHRAR